jgi:hypothetical protein
MQSPEDLRRFAKGWINQATKFPEGHPERVRLLGLAQDATQQAEQSEALADSMSEDTPAES